MEWRRHHLVKDYKLFADLCRFRDQMNVSLKPAEMLGSL